ncbi:MAG TPA: lipid A export permease/ATP-binding protein MsbA [Vicinamibacterales bacterium]|nr:lipid A export permease/ATP-binding protein MsbA [Vicinamibacterales bacterium]
MDAFLRLLRYATPHRAIIAGAALAMVVYGAANAALAYLIKPIIDDVLIAQNDLTFIAQAILVVYLVKGLGAYFSSYLMEGLGHRVVMVVRNQLFRHMLDQSAAFFARRAVGQLLSRINNDVGLVQRAVSETIGDLARESLVLVGSVVLLFYYDAKLALLCMTATPLIVYPLVRFGRRVRSVTRRSQEAQEHMSHVAAEAFAGHRIVKAFGAEAREAAKFETVSERLFRTNLKVTRVLALLPPLMEFLGGIAIAGALWYGSREIAMQRLTPGEFTSFLAALLFMYGPIKKLSRVNANLQQAAAASERIFEVLDVHTEVIERDGAVPMPPFTEQIEFRDVSFGYEDGHGRSTLRGVSCTVRAGQMIAIVGRSGAGKTTLVNLLPRFYDVTSGAILIDGRDIRDVTLASLRAQIGMVTQETVLFDDTIASNIAYGTPGASVEQIEAAARAANAHDFISAMPEGYRTTIGERGQRLSGGQRQRIAIARALLKNSPLLILDEATSALDMESERLVQQALATLMMNRTSFVIAHRLSTVRRADAIVVLDRGRIVEIGKHDELVARPNGVYARLHQMQLLESKQDSRELTAYQAAARAAAQKAERSR